MIASHVSSSAILSVGSFFLQIVVGCLDLMFEGRISILLFLMKSIMMIMKTMARMTM